MVRHRLDQRGRDAIKAGNIYVWEEQTQRGLSEVSVLLLLSFLKSLIVNADMSRTLDGR